jgi:hypothetical protein
MMWRAKNDRRTEALWHQEALHYENVNFNLAPVDHIIAAAEQNSLSAERPKNNAVREQSGSWAIRDLGVFRIDTNHTKCGATITRNGCDNRKKNPCRRCKRIFGSPAHRSSRRSRRQNMRGLPKPAKSWCCECIVVARRRP